MDVPFAGNTKPEEVTVISAATAPEATENHTHIIATDFTVIIGNWRSRVVAAAKHRRKANVIGVWGIDDDMAFDEILASGERSL